MPLKKKKKKKKSPNQFKQKSYFKSQQPNGIKQTLGDRGRVQEKEEEKKEEVMEVESGGEQKDRKQGKRKERQREKIYGDIS